MKKVLVIVAFFVLLGGSYGISPRQVFACGSSGCTLVEVEYCDIDPVYGTKTNCQTKWVCKVDITGDGSCYCCQNDDCMFGCGPNPSPNPPPPGGGPTPTPTPTPVSPATLRAVARQVSPDDTSCAAVNASTTGVDGTVFNFTAASANNPPPKTQTDNTLVSFTGQPPGSYTLVATPPSSDWVVQYPCYYRNGVLTGIGWTVYATGGDTIRWNIGYTLGAPWAQTSGGDVYASGALRSFIPPDASPRMFVLNGAGGYPGVVTYGSSYDFDPGSGTGATLVSSENWLANETYATTDWYDTFYRKFGSPTSPDYDCSAASCTVVTRPGSRATPYYVTGNINVASAATSWTVGNNENLVFLITGNLTINGKINITGKGFIAFIVNGNITVSPSVGSLYSDVTPDIEGIYITNGTFATGASTTAGKERLVLKGTFVADAFNLQRDLESVNHNTDRSAELFIYNPMLLITMPDAMKDTKVSWQEIAP